MNEIDFILEQLKDLTAIDSPTGFTEYAAEHVMNVYKKMGYAPVRTAKGGIFIDLGGKNEDDAILLTAHMDTLGAMVHTVKNDGRLKLTPLGGLNPNNTEGENCRIYTRGGRIYDGTFQLIDASIHVNGDYNEKKRTFDTMEVVLDEDVYNKEGVAALGIRTGDEVGHGCSYLPAPVSEVLAVDMGCVGEGLNCTERQVSICAKDSHGPYHYATVSSLVAAAEEQGIDFAIDIYPHYGSDADAALDAGYDIRHALIGAGVYASHGYERSHIEGVKNTLELLKAYLD